MAMNPVDSLQRSLVGTIGSVLEKRTSRRGFIATAMKTGVGVATWSIYGLLRPTAALASCPHNDCSCCSDGTVTCDCSCSDQCNMFTVSIFCCSIPGGTNNCPSGTYRSGWWRCSDTNPDICSGSYRYYIDCNPTPGPNQCPCTCPNGCSGHPSCRYCREWSQCNTGMSLGRNKCRIVRCQNPGTIFSDCSTTPVADGTPGECTCEATCAC